ncbi:hypothetical protein [Solibacillus sp. NPDC093137]|uniref:hypothetical protein n=1 Tax=Solibacillus sp. NPDC093137 TaxID=3390678 RepID=UPI003D03484A
MQSSILECIHSDSSKTTSPETNAQLLKRYMYVVEHYIWSDAGTKRTNRANKKQNCLDILTILLRDADSTLYVATSIKVISEHTQLSAPKIRMLIGYLQEMNILEYYEGRGRGIQLNMITAMDLGVTDEILEMDLHMTDSSKELTIFKSFLKNAALEGEYEHFKRVFLENEITKQENHFAYKFTE